MVLYDFSSLSLASKSLQTCWFILYFLDFKAKREIFIGSAHFPIPSPNMCHYQPVNWQPWDQVSTLTAQPKVVQHGTKLSHLGSRSSGWAVPIRKKGLVGLWGLCCHLIVEFPLHSWFQTPVPVGNESDWPSQVYAWCEWEWLWGTGEHSPVQRMRKLAPVDWLTGRKEDLLLVDLIFQQNPENWFYVKISQTVMVAQTFWTMWVNQNISFLLHLSPNWWPSVSIPSWTHSSEEDIFKGSPFCLPTVLDI